MRGYHTLKPDYDKWASTPAWTVEEACLLIIGIEPSLLDTTLLASVLRPRNGSEESDDLCTEFVSRLARGELEIEYRLNEHMANWGLLENLKIIHNYFWLSYCAGEFNQDKRTENCLFPPDIVCQVAFDSSCIVMHEFFKDHLRQIGFHFRYSESSAMFNIFKDFSKRDAWSQDEAIKLIMGEYLVTPAPNDFDEQEYRMLSNALRSSIAAKKLTPLNPNFECFGVFFSCKRFDQLGIRQGLQAT